MVRHYADLNTDWIPDLFPWAQQKEPELWAKMKATEVVINESFKTLTNQMAFKKMIQNLTYWAFILKELKTKYKDTKGVKRLPF